MQNYGSSYITQVPSSKNTSLRSYVNNLNSKIDYAKWKQDLVLSYNYMSLTNIKQKLQSEYQNHMKKMQAQQQKLRQVVENKEIISLINNMTNYKTKLLQNAQKTEIKIREQKLLVNKLNSQVNAKKTVLKQIIKSNKRIILQNLNDNGIKSARNLKQLFKFNRSRSNFSKNKSETTKTQRNSLADIGKSTQKQINMIYKSCLYAVLQKQPNTQRVKFEHIKSQRRKQSNQFLFNSVDKSKQKIWSWDQFKKLNSTEILNIIKEKQLQETILSNLLLC